jgi:hypothetical protein
VSSIRVALSLWVVAHSFENLYFCGKYRSEEFSERFFAEVFSAI